MGELEQIQADLNRIKDQNAEILKHLRAGQTDSTMVTGRFLAKELRLTGRDLHRLRRNRTIAFTKTKKGGYRYNLESVQRQIMNHA